MLLRQNALFSQTLGIMPIKCDQQLHLWGSIQHCYGVVWGPFKTRHESRAVKLTLDLICSGLSLGAEHPALCRGWMSKEPLCPLLPKEAACALSGSLAGGFWGRWVVLVTHPGRGCCGGEGLRLWLPEQGTLMYVQSTSQDCSPLFGLLHQAQCPGAVAKDSRSFQKQPAWQGSALQPPRLLLSWLCVLLGEWWLTWPTGPVLGQQREEELLYNSE